MYLLLRVFHRMILSTDDSSKARLSPLDGQFIRKGQRVSKKWNEKLKRKEKLKRRKCTDAHLEEKVMLSAICIFKSIICVHICISILLVYI